jgi:hypothetical protein
MLLRSAWLGAVIVCAVLLTRVSESFFVGLVTLFVGTLVVLGLTRPLRSLAPGGRFYWTMDWDEARKYPWRMRLFSFVAFWLITVLSAYLAGVAEEHWLAALLWAIPASLVFSSLVDFLWLRRP